MTFIESYPRYYQLGYVKRLSQQEQGAFLFGEMRHSSLALGAT